MKRYRIFLLIPLDSSKMFGLNLSKIFAITSYEEIKLLTFLASLNQLYFENKHIYARNETLPSSTSYS